MSYNFDSSNEIKNVSTIFLKILFSFAFLIWIADLKVHLRSAYGRDIHIEYFWRQFVSWKYLLHHNYSTIVEKMGWNTKCWHQLLAVITGVSTFQAHLVPFLFLFYLCAYSYDGNFLKENRVFHPTFCITFWTIIEQEWF